MRPFTLSALAWALLAAGPASAEFAIANCTMAKGCTCRLSDMTLSDFEMVTQAKPPAGARDMTLVQVPGRDPYWTSADRTSINVLHGGSGQCDLQLFNDTAPEDGNWRITAGQPDLSACPMLKGKMPGVAGMSSEVRRITWNGRFHPSRISDLGGMVEWRKAGPRTWRGTMAGGKQGKSGAKVEHGMTLENPRRIRGWSLFEFNIDLPGEQQATLSAMGMPMQCRSYTPFTAQRVS